MGVFLTISQYITKLHRNICYMKISSMKYFVLVLKINLASKLSDLHALGSLMIKLLHYTICQRYLGIYYQSTECNDAKRNRKILKCIFVILLHILDLKIQRKPSQILINRSYIINKIL